MLGKLGSSKCNCAERPPGIIKGPALCAATFSCCPLSPFGCSLWSSFWSRGVGKGSQKGLPGSTTLAPPGTQNASCFLLWRPSFQLSPAGVSPVFKRGWLSSLSHHLLNKAPPSLALSWLFPSLPALTGDITCLGFLSLTLIQCPQHKLPEFRTSSAWLIPHWPPLCIRNVNKGRAVSSLRDRGCPR